MSDTTSSHSPQVKFILEWLEVIRRKDLDNIAKPLPKDYHNIVYPRSLGRPEQTREEYLEYVAELFNLWTEFELTVHSITDAPGTVVYHATYKAKTTVGVEISRESVFVKHIVTDEDGSLKIKVAEEFIDSKAYLDNIQAVAAAKAKGQ